MLPILIYFIAFLSKDVQMFDKFILCNRPNHKIHAHIKNCLCFSPKNL